MNNPKIGGRYIFAYPEEFSTLPDYSAHRGVVVTVLRKCTDKEADPIFEDGFVLDRMYQVKADDGWEGQAWDSELETAV